jgi:hypothetical protein
MDECKRIMKFLEIEKTEAERGKKSEIQADVNNAIGL